MPSNYEEFRHEAVHRLMACNEQCETRFRIGSWDRWDYDLDASTLTFSSNGAARVVASIVVVGTTSSASGTWMWAWANPSLPEACWQGLERVRRFGVDERYASFCQDVIPDDEHLGWELTAVAASVLDAIGGYRCPSERGFIYVVFQSLCYVS